MPDLAPTPARSASSSGHGGDDGRDDVPVDRTGLAGYVLLKAGRALDGGLLAWRRLGRWSAGLVILVEVEGVQSWGGFAFSRFG
jgi:hypothetical protein